MDGKVTDLEEEVPDFLNVWLNNKRLSIYTEDRELEGTYKIEVKADILPMYYSVVPSEQPTMTIDIEILAPLVAVGIRNESLGLPNANITAGDEFFYSVGNHLVKCQLGTYRQVIITHNTTADFLKWDQLTKILTIDRGGTENRHVGEYPIRVA